jgi:hypothetical protein
VNGVLFDPQACRKKKIELGRTIARESEFVASVTNEVCQLS